MNVVVRRLVPRSIRLLASAQLASLRSVRLRRRLTAIAADTRPIVAGPWLGEVGFELLYWVPFLRWFAEQFRVAPDRLVIVSRGGTESWYRPFAARYQEIFDFVSPEEFRRRYHQRVLDLGEQKQTRITPFERSLLDDVANRIGAQDPIVVHPSLMYELFNPFWWGHLDEQWVHRHARYRPLETPVLPEAVGVPRSYVAVKFYFNDCFPATERNRAFVRDVVQQLAARTPVVSLTTGLTLDDHGGCPVVGKGVTTVPLDLDARCNMHVQSAIVANASVFVGTYGGFSYLAPFYGVRSIAYYGDPGGFSRRHLQMAYSALGTVNAGDLLVTQSTEQAHVTSGSL